MLYLTCTNVHASGDMGVSEYNNMQNLMTDCQSGKIDVFAREFL